MASPLNRFSNRPLFPRTSSLTYNVRPFESADRAAVILLWLEAFPDSAGYNEPSVSIDRKCDFGDGLFFVVELHRQLVGTVMAGYDGHRGWIYSLAVRAAHRRKGIGTALVRHAEQQLGRLGCPKVNLQVRAENASVVAFYESLGFVVERRISLGKPLNPRLSE